MFVGYINLVVFCGDIFQRVRIHLPSMSITFPFQPTKSMNDKALLLEGIRTDTEHFRFLVENLILKAGNHLAPLSDDLKFFFFSSLFSLGLTSRKSKVVLRYSFMQLFHPATFNAADRLNFINAVANYRSYNFKLFDTTLRLNKKVYQLSKWKTIIGQNLSLTRIADRIIRCNPSKKATKQNYCGYIPWFIRCLHNHFIEND